MALARVVPTGPPDPDPATTRSKGTSTATTAAPTPLSQELLLPLAMQLKLRDGEIEELAAYIDTFVKARPNFQPPSQMRDSSQLVRLLFSVLALGCWVLLCTLEVLSAALGHPIDCHGEHDHEHSRWSGSVVSCVVLALSFLAFVLVPLWPGQFQGPSRVGKIRPGGVSDGAKGSLDGGTGSVGGGGGGDGLPPELPPRRRRRRELLSCLFPYCVLSLGCFVWTCLQALDGIEGKIWAGILALYCTVSLCFCTAMVTLHSSAVALQPRGSSLGALPPPAVLKLPPAGLSSPPGAPGGARQPGYLTKFRRSVGSDPGPSTSVAALGADGHGRADGPVPSCDSFNSGFLMQSDASCRTLSSPCCSSTRHGRRWQPLFTDPTFGGNPLTEEQISASLALAQEKVKENAPRGSATDINVPPQDGPSTDLSPGDGSETVAKAPDGTGTMTHSIEVLEGCAAAGPQASLQRATSSTSGLSDVSSVELEAATQLQAAVAGSSNNNSNNNNTNNNNNNNHSNSNNNNSNSNSNTSNKLPAASSSASLGDVPKRDSSAVVVPLSGSDESLVETAKAKAKAASANMISSSSEGGLTDVSDIESPPKKPDSAAEPNVPSAGSVPLLPDCPSRKRAASVASAFSDISRDGEPPQLNAKAETGTSTATTTATAATVGAKTSKEGFSLPMTSLFSPLDPMTKIRKDSKASALSDVS